MCYYHLSLAGAVERGCGVQHCFLSKEEHFGNVVHVFS